MINLYLFKELEITLIKPITLYVKTHNITKLKYFGKTVHTDVNKYKGSGTRWLNHIKKHGYDISTEIVGIFYDKEKCKKFALEFSIKQANIDTLYHQW
ncbi:MAG: hypothetical protein QXN55_01135 [Candidatus Nitrosotenuis sp.]